ncbi:hypothetical protein TSTA_025460 [Talaromyces stipitatus ATCC 10500]|uniref:Sacsin/Nov domain-containing protein n=1 Tax=Talaromyces stipitatus (strain ATCC 10500 / CBS 375.48 / QM 6759 / NRRL 1006) TaxID=441959 RepID=B8M4N4_TALSN|nr:uncharacterized protein TSTA_025460 [Talaromyces stipitatus ATCC 10500]EED19229.1 hypothetical protein TSTA_025460 [Talaromyces stipitatus ATCC 10500]
MLRTVLREMIQNAADASATRVTVKFETLPSTTVPLPNPADPTAPLKHIIAHHTLRRLIISNNGHAFTEKDWSRLKRIADGNPDETKIGVFRVGFYSVFDDCEEPFVSSGNAAMAFYWKGNSLFTSRLELSGTNASPDTSPDTTFVLDYRNDISPVPSLLELAKFLATSLTFVGLESIDLWLDNWNLLRLNKKVAPSEKVTIPRDIETKTVEGLMEVTSVIREVAQVDATWIKLVEWSPQNTLSARLEGIRDTTTTVRSFFSKFTGWSRASDKPPTESVERLDDAEDLTENQKASVFLHINTASVQSSISNSLASELERATRKPQPKRTTIAILFTKKLIDVGLVTEVTVSGIKRELENNALISAQLVEFISWIGKRAASGELDQKTTKSLLSVAVANEKPSEGQAGQLLTLAGIDCYLNPARIRSDLPIPPSVIPFKYTKSLEKSQLDAVGWKELQIVPWLRWLVENAGNRGVLPVEKDITRTASFAAQILPVLSKQ